MDAIGSSYNKTKENIEFPKNAAFVVYLFPEDGKPFEKYIEENEKDLDKLKKIAPEWSYGFILKDDKKKKLLTYIIDGMICDDEDVFFDSKLKEAYDKFKNSKLFVQCSVYVKTRIKDVLLGFNPKTMKTI